MEKCGKKRKGRPKGSFAASEPTIYMYAAIRKCKGEHKKECYCKRSATAKGLQTKKATSKVCNADNDRETMPVLSRRASISPAVTFGAVDGPDVRCASSSSSSSSPSSSFSSFSRFRRTRSDDAVLARLPKVTTISDDDLLHLIVSMQRKAQRRAQVLPCLVSKAAAKAASKSAASKAQLLCHYLDAFAAAELGWLTSTLWLTVFLDSLTDDQLLQAITAMVQEVHRRAQQVLDRSRANADGWLAIMTPRVGAHYIT